MINQDYAVSCPISLGYGRVCCLKVKIFSKSYENHISFLNVTLLALPVTEKLEELFYVLFHPLDCKLPEDQDFILVPPPFHDHISENFIWHFLIKVSRMN